jgi:hypothetical protein
MGDGQWAMGNGRWAMGNGRWAMGNGQWAMGNGQWAMGNGQWAMGNGQWAMGNFTEKVPERLGELFAFGHGEAGKSGLGLRFSHGYWWLELVIAMG